VKRTILAALALALATPASAQVVDSISVQVLGEPAALLVDGPMRAYVGDTLTFRYTVVDELGEPTIGVVTWEVEDPTRAAILAETDSTLVVRLDRTGRLNLIATVNRLTEIVIGGVYGTGSGSNEGMFQWASAGPFVVTVGGTVRLCAAGFAGDQLIFVSGQPCLDALARLEPVDQFYRLVSIDPVAIKGWDPPISVRSVAPSLMAHGG